MRKKFRSEFLKTIIQLSTAAFALVAALAWNNAIQEFLNRFFTSGAGLKSKFAYAIIVTVVAVVVTVILANLQQEACNDEQKKR